MVGTVEEALAKKASEIEFGGLTEYDKERLGAAIRLEIPFTDEFKLQQIADMLRGLAADIDHISRNASLPLASRLMLMKSHAQQMNRRIRKLHGKYNPNGTTRRDS